MRGPSRRAVAGLAMVVALGGCSSNSVNDRARDGSQENFIVGDSRVQTIAPDQRLEPVALTGTTLDGQPWTIDSTRGKPLVINIWASWCPPCRAEAPAIKAVSESPEFADTVAFVGIDQRESAETGLAQAKAWGHTFPSLTDDGGVAVLALQGRARATPSTLILDPQGRIATYVGGPVTEAMLTGMIQDVLKEGGST